LACSAECGALAPPAARRCAVASGCERAAGACAWSDGSSSRGLPLAPAWLAGALGSWPLPPGPSAQAVRPHCAAVVNYGTRF
jgi:hypothetical protein